MQFSFFKNYFFELYFPYADSFRTHIRISYQILNRKTKVNLKVELNIKIKFKNQKSF